MPSKSKSQQRLFGMVANYLHKKEDGEGQAYLDEIESKYSKSLADKIKSIADGERRKTGDRRKFTKGVDLETARDFAKTKHEKLPEEVLDHYVMTFEQFVNESYNKKD